MPLCQSEYILKETLCIYIYTVQAVFNEIFPWTKETALTWTKWYEVLENIFTFFLNIQTLQYRATTVWKADNSPKSL